MQGEDAAGRGEPKTRQQSQGNMRPQRGAGVGHPTGCAERAYVRGTGRAQDPRALPAHLSESRDVTASLVKRGKPMDSTARPLLVNLRVGRHTAHCGLKLSTRANGKGGDVTPSQRRTTPKSH